MIHYNLVRTENGTFPDIVGTDKNNDIIQIYFNRNVPNASKIFNDQLL